MSERCVTVILKSCEGYGIQSETSIIKVQSETMSIKMECPVGYLLDEKGHVACTIVSDQYDYVSNNNQDRRYQNNYNGFSLEWNEDGSECTVYCTANHAAYTLSEKIKTSVSVFFRNVKRMVCAVGAFFRYLKQTVKKEGDEESKVVIKSWISGSSYMREALHYKRLLQSQKCTQETVKEVSVWWAQQGDKDVESIMAVYKFSQALMMYRLFYQAKKYDEIKRLSTMISVHREVFSKRQMDVVREYARSNRRFSDWRREMGMSFSKPYELQYMV